MALRFTQKDGFDSVKEEFLTLDVNQWIKDNRIAAEGTRRGVLDQPPSDAESLDATEEQIFNWVSGRAKKCRQDVSNYLKVLSNKLTGLNMAQNLPELRKRAESKAKELEVKFDDVLDRALRETNPLERDFLAAQEDLANFKAAANLIRPANWDKRSASMYYIVVFFIAEVILNASLLMPVSQSGLVGSILTMALVSAMNVLCLAFVFGGLIRQTRHVSINTKIISYIGMVIVIVIAFVFNLSVGHLRDSMQGILTDPNADALLYGNYALQRLMENRLQLEDFRSAFLTSMGLVLFFISSWKWLQMDDDYPDYGKRTRNVEKLRSKYYAQRNYYVKFLQDIYSKGISDIDDQINQVRMQSPSEFDENLTAKTVLENFSNHISQYDSDLRTIIAAYRTANTAARTSAVPSYFESYPTIDDELKQPPKFTSPSGVDVIEAFDALYDAKLKIQEKCGNSIEDFRNSASSPVVRSGIK